jgi:flagellar motor component MotA
VDATYRADLRELNELNFARFDAKVEQRLTQLGADLRLEIHTLRVEIQTARADLVKWMFGFWAPTALGIVGTALGVVVLLLRR